jgi:hypothetical protein
MIMAGTRRLSIEVVGDARGVSKAFGEVDSAAGRMEQNVGKKFGGMGLAIAGGATAGAAAAAGLVIAGAKINTMGLQLETMGIKAATVFEGSIGTVEKWAEANSKAMGLTSTEAQGLAANMGDLLKPMGFTAAQSADMATEMTGLSGALSAWSGGTKSAAEVSDIMTKAMLGETDGLKQLGISIGAADVAARLAEKGQSDLTGAALAQAEAVAVQELILEKSTDAQKAWADGSMDSVKASNAQKAGLNQLKETLVTTLYPAIQGLMPYLANATEWLGENLPKSMAVIKEWVQANWPRIRDTITEVLTFISDYTKGFIETVQSLWAMFGERIMTVVTNAFDFVRGQVESVLKVIRGIIDVVMGLIRGDWGQAWDGIKQIFAGVWDAIGNVLTYALRTIGLILDMAWENVKSVVKAAWGVVVSTVSGAIGEVVGFVTGIPGRIVGTISGLWSGITSGIQTVRGQVKTWIDSIVDVALALPRRMAGIFSGMWDGIKTAFRSALNFVIDGWNGLDFKVPGFSAFGKTIGGFTLGLPTIPRLHSGGVAGGMSFAGLRNNEVAAILERGEVVLNQGQLGAVASGGGTTVVNVTVMATPGTNRVELGRELIELIQDAERSNGAAWRGAMVTA